MKNNLLDKYGRYVSEALFTGKGKRRNLAILEVLALEGKMTCWELTKKVFRKIEKRYPTYDETRHFYLYRPVKKLEKHDYLMSYGTVKSKGTENPIYGLTAKGFLVANLLSLDVRNNWKKAAKNYQEDLDLPERTLMSWIINHGFSQQLFSYLFLEPFKKIVLAGGINLDIIDSEEFYKVMQEIKGQQISSMLREFTTMLSKKRATKRFRSFWQNLSQEDKKALIEMFRDQKLKEVINGHFLGRLEQSLKDRLKNIKFVRQKYSEYFKNKNQT